MKIENKPRVSIILPYYNGKQFIKETIDSICEQTYSDFELLVIDDGSPSAEDVRFVKEYVESLDDSRIKYIWKSNGGLSDARNFGINSSAGALIAFQDQDDIWEPSKLEKQVAVFDLFPDIQVVVTDGVFFGEREGSFDVSSLVSNRPGLLRDTFDRMLLRNFVIATSIVFTRTLSDKVGASNRRYIVVPDYEIFIRFAAVCDFFIIPERLVKYRLHGSNTTKAKFRGFAECMCVITERDLSSFKSRVCATIGLTRLALFFVWNWFRKGALIRNSKTN
jgi:glycosyltransferase involved in cell wall biosynthesis